MTGNNREVARGGIANVLRARRSAAGLTQQALAFESGLSISTIQRMERGAEPTFSVIQALAVGLRCSPADLLADLAPERVA